MIMIIGHLNKENKEYRIEFDTISSGNGISIFRYDGEGVDIIQDDIYDMVNDWFMKKMEAKYK